MDSGSPIVLRRGDFATFLLPNGGTDHEDQDSPIRRKDTIRTEIISKVCT